MRQQNKYLALEWGHAKTVTDTNKKILAQGPNPKKVGKQGHLRLGKKYKVSRKKEKGKNSGRSAEIGKKGIFKNCSGVIRGCA